MKHGTQPKVVRGIPHEVVATGVARARSSSGVVAVITAPLDLSALLGLHVSRAGYDDFLDLLYINMSNAVAVSQLLLVVPVDHNVCTILLQALAGGGVFVAALDNTRDVVQLFFTSGSYGCRQTLRGVLYEHRQRLVQQHRC